MRFLWDLVHQHRERVGSVLDLGAGDGKFALYGRYDSYLGVEVDKSRITESAPRAGARVQRGCAFRTPRGLFDACVGNPPYLRHHDIESPWKERTIARINNDLGVCLDGRSNLFLYFLALALLRTSATGIVAMVIPFDWVSRPSAKALRRIIREHGWNVSVYRFSYRVFTEVDTTASVSIIDKHTSDGLWSFFDVNERLQTARRRGATGTGKRVLAYEKRGQLFSRRGLSPGTQQVFTLTEGERVHHGLARGDMLPCVTTLRGVPRNIAVLDSGTFEREFVKGGRRCWLVRSRGTIHPRLQGYLDGVPATVRETATCKRRDPWYEYEDIGVPDLLVHSGFTTEGPRVLINEIRAVPVGAMYGIYGCPAGQREHLQRLIDSMNIIGGVVPHSRRLRKVEVGQLNCVLSKIELDPS